MQFKIPQNVQIEDKIVGPLTFRQLIVLGIGGGLAYMVYLSLAKEYFMEIWLPPVAVIILFTLAFAFVKPLGVTFMHYVLLWLEFSFLARKKVWVKGADYIRPTLFTNMESNNKMRADVSSDVRKQTKSIDEISEIVDKHI